jgi:hypothetical protein
MSRHERVIQYSFPFGILVGATTLLGSLEVTTKKKVSHVAQHNTGPLLQ